jgi:TPR repeat protein
LVNNSSDESNYHPDYVEGSKAYSSHKYAIALKWFEKAALENDPLSINNLGGMYENGRGVAKDYKLALEFYHRAAALGLDVAHYNIGDIYLYGIGEKKDYTIASSWYKKAADLGHKGALQRLQVICRKFNYQDACQE